MNVLNSPRMRGTRRTIAAAAVVSTSLALAAPAGADPVSLARAQGMVHYMLATGGDSFTQWQSTYEGFDTKAPYDNSYMTVVKKALDEAAVTRPDLYHAKPSDLKTGSVNPAARIEAMKVVARWSLGGASKVELGTRRDGTVITYGDINPEATSEQDRPATVADLIAERAKHQLSTADSPLMKASILIDTDDHAWRNKLLLDIADAKSALDAAEQSGDADALEAAQAEYDRVSHEYTTLFDSSEAETLTQLSAFMDEAKAKGLYGKPAEDFLIERLRQWSQHPTMTREQVDAFASQSFDIAEAPASKHYTLTDLLNMAIPQSLLEHSGAIVASNNIDVGGPKQNTSAFAVVSTVSGVAHALDHQKESLQHVLDEVSKATGGQVQAAIDVGYTSASVNTATTYPAWSTSKVALAIAALNAKAVDTSTVNAAITASDNAAAGKLWTSLGGGSKAASAADAVLRAGGDNATHYQSKKTTQFSAFGQTLWKAGDQAHFGRNVACISGSDYVVGAMGRIISSQAYGMGHIKGAHFKGGWGPDPAGKYTTRQFGYAPDGHGGTIGIALVARPGDGTYPSGQALLNKAADIINKAIANGTIKGGTPCSDAAPKQPASTPKSENKQASNKTETKKKDDKPAKDTKKQDDAQSGVGSKPRQPDAQGNGPVQAAEDKPAAAAGAPAPAPAPAPKKDAFAVGAGNALDNQPHDLLHPVLPNPEQAQKLAELGSAGLAGATAAAAPFKAGVDDALKGFGEDKWDGSDESIHAAWETTKRHMTEDKELMTGVISAGIPVVARFGPELAASAPLMAGFIATGHLELAAGEFIAHSQAYLSVATAVVVPVAMKAMQLGIDLARVVGNGLIGLAKGANKVVHDFVCDHQDNFFVGGVNNFFHFYECEGEGKGQSDNTPADPYELKAESLFVGFPNVKGLKVYDELRENIKKADGGKDEEANADAARRLGINKLNATAEQRDLHQAHYIEVDGKLLPGQKDEGGDKESKNILDYHIDYVKPGRLVGQKFVNSSDAPESIKKVWPDLAHRSMLSRSNDLILRDYFYSDGTRIKVPVIVPGTTKEHPWVIMDAATFGYKHKGADSALVLDVDNQTKDERAAEVELLKRLHQPLTKVVTSGDKTTTVANHVSVLASADALLDKQYTRNSVAVAVPNAADFYPGDVQAYPFSDVAAQSDLGPVQFVDKNTGEIIAAPAVAKDGHSVTSFEVDPNFDSSSATFIAFGMPDASLARVSKDGVVPALVYQNKYVDPVMRASDTQVEATADAPRRLYSRQAARVLFETNDEVSSNLGLNATGMTAVTATLPESVHGELSNSTWEAKGKSSVDIVGMEEPVNFYRAVKDLTADDAAASKAEGLKHLKDHAVEQARRVGGDEMAKAMEERQRAEEALGSEADKDTAINSAPDGNRITGGLRVSLRLNGHHAKKGDVMYVDVGLLPKAGKWQDRQGSFVPKSVFVRGQSQLIVTPLEYSGESGTLKVTFLRDAEDFAFDLIGMVNIKDSAAGAKDLRVTPVTFYRKDMEKPQASQTDKLLAGHGDDYHMQVLTDRAHLWAPNGIPDSQPEQAAAAIEHTDTPSKGDRSMVDPHAGDSNTGTKGTANGGTNGGTNGGGANGDANGGQNGTNGDAGGPGNNAGTDGSNGSTVGRNEHPEVTYDPSFHDPDNTRNLPTIDEAKEMAKDGTLQYNSDGTADIWLPGFGEITMDHDLKDVAFAKMTPDQAKRLLAYIRRLTGLSIEALDKNGYVNKAALTHISGQDGADAYVDENNCLVFVRKTAEGAVKRYAGDDLGNKSCAIYDDKRSASTPATAPRAEGHSSDAKDSNTNGPDEAAPTPDEKLDAGIVNAAFGSAVDAMSKDKGLQDLADKSGASKVLPDVVRADLANGGNGQKFYSDTPGVSSAVETQLPTTGQTADPNAPTQPGDHKDFGTAQGNVIGSGKGTIDTNSGDAVAALTPSETKRLRLIDTVNSLRGTGKVSDETISELLDTLRSTDGKNPQAVDSAEQKIKDALGGDLPAWQDPYASAGKDATKDVTGIQGAASTPSKENTQAAKAAGSTGDTGGVVYGQGTTSAGTTDSAATGEALAQSADRSTGKGPVTSSGDTATGKGLVTGEGAAERDWMKIGLGAGLLVMAILSAVGGFFVLRRRED